MRQFNLFFSNKCLYALKSSNIEGNLGRSASYLISVDAKYANISYKIYILFWGEILVALDTHAKKMNPPSIILGGVARYGLLAHSLLYCVDNLNNSCRVKL